MKKIFTLFAAALMTVSLSAASFGILVNGKMYFAGEDIGQDPYGEGFQQYLAHVPVSSGDFLQLCDAGSSYATWAVDLNTSSVDGFTRDGNKYNVTVSGCYDFYIKIKDKQDQLYIGNGSNCGSGVDITGGQGGQGGQGGGVDDDDVLYYAMGWINGEDHGETAYDKFEEEYLFEDGKLTIDCKMGSYIAIKDHMGNFYYSKTQTTIANTSVTYDWANGWSGGQKWAIPQGVNYIIMRSATFKGQIVLERVDKETYDAYHIEGNQAVDEIQATEKAHKVFIDGQLRIVRGDKVFDITGRQL